MTCNQVIQDLKNTLACENKHICELQEKLVTYDEDIEKKNELKTRCGNLQQRAEDLENKMKQMNEEQLCMIGAQKRKLKTIEEEECCLRSKINKALDTNDCMTKKINSLTDSERRHLTEIEDSEKLKRKLENELCDAEAKANELRRTVECLTKNVKSKDEELSCVRGRVCERHAEQRRLRDAYCRLQTEVECNRSKVADAKSRTARLEECLAQEKRALCTGLEAKRAALRDVKAELADAKRTAECQRVNAGRLVALAAEQRDANERDRRDAAAQAQRMNKENRDKEESVCRMKHQMSELRRDDERIAADTEAVRAQVRASECLLDKCSETGLPERDECGRREQLERDRDTLACDVRQKSKKIADLELEVCCLRGEIGALQTCCKSTCTPACPAPAVPPCCPVPVAKKCPPAPPPTTVICTPVKTCPSIKCSTAIDTSDKCTCSMLR